MLLPPRQEEPAGRLPLPQAIKVATTEVPQEEVDLQDPQLEVPLVVDLQDPQLEVPPVAGVDLPDPQPAVPPVAEVDLQDPQEG